MERLRQGKIKVLTMNMVKELGTEIKWFAYCASKMSASFSSLCFSKNCEVQESDI